MIDHYREDNIIDKYRNKLIDITMPIVDYMSGGLHYCINIKQNVSDILNLKEKYDSLIKENELLKYNYDNTKLFIYENIELKKLLNFIENKQFEYVTAKVVGNVSGPYTRKSIIMVGEENDIKRGELVINNDGLIGRITEIGNNYSRILHLTDINSKIPVLFTESREQAIVAGDNSEELKIAYLNRDNNIKPGEIVVTIGDGSNFPSGIIVGHVEFNEQNIPIVKPIVNLNKLDFVAVIKY